MNLSADAVPEAVRALKLGLDDNMKEELAAGLDRRYASSPCYERGNANCDNLSFDEKLKMADKSIPWQSFNLSKARAIAALKENSQDIRKYLVSRFEKEAADCRQGAAVCEKKCAAGQAEYYGGANLTCDEQCGVKSCEIYDMQAKANR